MAKSRKLPMIKRETEKQRSVSFTKRRHGLFNKAAELFMLCDARLAVLVSSPCSKPKRKFYSFGHPSVGAVLNAFLQNRFPYEIDDKAKQYALSLSDEVESLERELNLTLQGSKKNSTPEFSISSEFENFENSESIEELQKLVHSLEKLIHKATSRWFNNDNNNCNNAVINIHQSLDDSPKSELFPAKNTSPTSKTDSSDPLDYCYNYDNLLGLPESAFCSELKEEGGSGNITHDFDFQNWCNFVGAMSNSRQDDDWSFTNSSMSSMAVQLSSNDFANDYEDLWTSLI